MDVTLLQENVGFIKEKDSFPSDCVLEDLFKFSFKLFGLYTKVTAANGK